MNPPGFAPAWVMESPKKTTFCDLRIKEVRMLRRDRRVIITAIRVKDRMVCIFSYAKPTGKCSDSHGGMLRIGSFIRACCPAHGWSSDRPCYYGSDISRSRPYPGRAWGYDRPERPNTTRCLGGRGDSSL